MSQVIGWEDRLQNDYNVSSETLNHSSIVALA